MALSAAKRRFSANNDAAEQPEQKQQHTFFLVERSTLSTPGRFVHKFKLIRCLCVGKTSARRQCVWSACFLERTDALGLLRGFEVAKGTRSNEKLDVNSTLARRVSNWALQSRPLGPGTLTPSEPRRPGRGTRERRPLELACSNCSNNGRLFFFVFRF